MAKSGTANFYNGVATTSLRLDSPASKALNRTMTTGNRRLFTYSFWFKTTKLGSRFLLAKGTNIAYADISKIQINSSDQLVLQEIVDDSTSFNLVTTRLFRDTSAWYNVVIAFDTAQGTDTNRVKVYVNGVQETSFGTASYPSQDYDALYTFNQSGSSVLQIGRYSASTDSAEHWDGYLSDITHIDGSALTPSSFGEFKNGVWIPIDTSGLTFGDEGFLLKFDQVGVGTASTSTIGADASGNANHFSSTNIVASDCAMPDSPENNFNTFSPLIPFNSGTLTEGNLKSNNVLGGTNVGPMSAFGVTTGKWFCEMYIHDIGGGDYVYAGAFLKRIDSNVRFGVDLAVPNDGSVYFEGAAQGSSLETSANGHIYGFAVDCDNFTAQVYKTVGGTYGTYGPEVDWSGAAHKNSGYMGIGHFGASGTSGRDGGITVNYGQDPSFAGAITAGTETPSEGAGVFKLAPPSGYLALCTSNLPEPTIGPNSDTQADDYFETILYEGNGSTQNIAVNFKPDWTWIKNRDATDAHQLFDSTRGATNVLVSNTNAAEAANDDTLTAFISTGFSLGDDVTVNTNNESYASWNWKANGGTTVTNEDGSIDSTVQANTTAGFSVVTTTSPSSGTWSVGHGLGVKPSMIIQKYRAGTGRWTTWHNILTSGQYLGLNETTAIASSGTPFNFTITDALIGGNINYDNGSQTVVYYVFADVEGYSKMGSYTGNGNADGTFVYTGFRPAWVMMKRTDSGGGWHILDNKRAFAGNEIDVRLEADNSDAEGTGGPPHTDFLSNGFKLRTSFDNMNATGGTYIYMAFAEAPFKYANAR